MPIDRDRIRERLSATGQDMQTASLTAGQNRAWLSNVMNWRAKDPRADAIRRLADVLDCDMAYLYGEQDMPRKMQSTATPRDEGGVRKVPRRGEVRAGHWVEIDQSNQIEDYLLIDLNLPLDANVEAYTVVGDSMDLAGIMDGDTIICIRNGEPYGARDGDDVVVERTMMGGHLRELTVKRMFTHPDGMIELRPMSSNRSHKSLRIFPEGSEEDGTDETVSIVAVVEDIMRKHRRRYRA